MKSDEKLTTFFKGFPINIRLKEGKASSKPGSSFGPQSSQTVVLDFLGHFDHFSSKSDPKVDRKVMKVDPKVEES